MSLDSPKNIPEFVETDIEESLKARTEQLSLFRDLGPPDLVHYRRVSGSKEVGAYHYVAGVDSSSSAALAAYLQDLRYMLPRQWAFQTGTYCCFNAFSRVDMRVEVKIPGGVKMHAIDERGTNQEATDALWLETYLSSMIRSILYADDESYRITGYRRLNPIPNKEAERRFLDAAERLFPSGWQLGSDAEVQVANLATNHLTSALMKYFCITGRWEQGINLFQRLREREPEVDLLLAQLYLQMDEEVKAVDLMCTSLVANPLSHGFLVTQAQYLLKKNRPDLAVELAKAAVNANPSEYATWAILTESYIAIHDFENALLTLNSCPMFTFHEKDNHKIASPAKMHLPIPTEVTQSQIFDLPDIRNQDTDPNLLKLPAPGLHGTFAKAYGLLTKINGQIGWDSLLKARSNVFVMEEEYRIERGKPVEADAPATNGVPSSEPDAERKSISSLEPRPPTPSTPSTAHHPNEIGLPPSSAEDNANEVHSMFQSKRLCERWLDNLFMVLYEDLRVYTLWRAEWEHFTKQQLKFNKQNNEWEMLGELALRLHHKEEAQEAFHACLDTGFSAKAWRNLLPIYESHRQPEHVLTAIAKLSAWNLRWYSEFSPDLVRAFREVVETEGATKVRSLLMAPGGYVAEMMKGMFDMVEAFEMKGHEL